MNLIRNLAILLLIAAMPGPVLAQFETATVLGTVRDATNAVVPDATVTHTNSATGVSITRTTNAEGNYEFVTVSAGMYLLTVEKSGFAMAMIENVGVQVGSRLRVDAQMNVGQVSERIQVTGSAPLIETETSARGQIITGDQTRALPLNGPEYSALALLTTGVRLSALNNNQAGSWQREQLHDPSAVHQPHRQSRRQSGHADQRSRVDLRQIRLARSQHR